MVALAVIPAISQAETGQDRVVLKNGSLVIGTVIDSRDGVLTLETDFAGTLSVQMEHVASVESAAPVVVLLEDDSVHEESSLNIQGDQLALGSAMQPVPLDELRLINPRPWELGHGYWWNGSFGLGFVMERGNTDTDELDVKIESVWRSLEDRYTLKWQSEQDKNNNEKTSDNWQGSAKYDYFLTDPNYVGLLGLAESDKFQDLDLRYMIGPFIGRQFIDQPILSISGELGIGYVNEDFKIAEDQDYPASFWNANGSSKILGGFSTIYIDQLGIWNLDETSDVIIDTTFGLSFPLLWNIEAAAEILLEYDSGAVGDVEELDQTYKFRVNYTWD